MPVSVVPWIFVPHNLDSSVAPRQSIFPSFAFSIGKHVNWFVSSLTNKFSFEEQFNAECERQPLSSAPLGQFHILLQRV